MAGAMKVPTRPPIDWEAVEQAYRAGTLSVREIARQHGCTHKAITKRAEREDWKRDLSEKVRREANARLVAGTVPKSVPTVNARDIVASGADLVVAVVTGHRKSLQREQGIIDRGYERLGAEGADMPLREYADVADTITRAAERVRKGQRQAFNIDAEQGSGSTQTANVVMVRFDGLSDDPRERARQLADDTGSDSL